MLAVVLYTFDVFRAQQLCSAGLMLGLLDPCDNLGTKVSQLSAQVPGFETLACGNACSIKQVANNSTHMTTMLTVGLPRLVAWD